MFLHPEVSFATVPLCPPLTPSAALPCLQLGLWEEETKQPSPQSI